MALKTYSISTDITGAALNSSKLHREIEEANVVSNFNGLSIDGDNIDVLGDSILNLSAMDTIVSEHNISEKISYLIESDMDQEVIKDFKSINYKTELKSGVSYNPVFYIHTNGANAGFLEKTEYYKDYIDENNMGTLILVVEESYTIDNSDPTLPYTARAATDRTKTWKWVDVDGALDAVNVKTKIKKYDTRRKRKIEAERRRDNVIEQLIDNVGLAGVLSGAFTDADEAYDKLTDLQELHATAFVGWRSSGRGSLVDVIQNDVTTTWLDTVIPDNASTQSMCPWMIGLTFRSYIQDKLKGNIA